METRGSDGASAQQDSAESRRRRRRERDGDLQRLSELPRRGGRPRKPRLHVVLRRRITQRRGGLRARGAACAGVAEVETGCGGCVGQQGLRAGVRRVLEAQPVGAR